jgi:hypothetical protein
LAGLVAGFASVGDVDPFGGVVTEECDAASSARSISASVGPSPSLLN